MISLTYTGIQGAPMEDLAILSLNLDRFRRLLKTATDPAKRQTILKLIRETETKLRQHPSAGKTWPRSRSPTDCCLE
jgi:cytochrome c-type biogenesis protein CcmH/NrfG